MKEKIRHLMDRIRRWYVKRITSRYPEKRSLRRPSFAARYRIARDRRLNTPFPAVRDFIGAQGGGGDADRLHFGFAKMSFCGCEVIAVYNALLHLGSWRDIRRVAQDLMAHGAVFGGLLGVRPDAIASYFSRNHFPVRFEVFTENGAEVTADGLAKPEAEPEAASPDEEPAVTAAPEAAKAEPAGPETVQAEDAGPEAVREEAAEAVQAEDAEAEAAGDAAPKKEMHRIPEECVELLTFWNGPDKWTIHTVMIEPLENGMLRVYNRHTNTLYTIYSSYEQFLSTSDVVPIARITVGQREYAEDLSEIEPEEAAGEAVEEAPEEAAGEAVEEAPEETAGEAVEEVPEEAAEEAVEEAPEEAAGEAVEEAAADEAAEEAAEETFMDDEPEVTAAEEAGTLPEEIPEAQKAAPESQNCGGQ
ncbi:MAG: hypothetical protein IJL72_10940 [Lachnospiraceae bacterium]|nr:hypothetical protein [Lachnospiraceae bacterium]